MPGLFLLTAGTRVNLRREVLEVQLPPTEDMPEGATMPITNVPLWDLEHAVITDRVNMTIPALAELLRREIPVIVTSHGERIIGLCLPPAPNSVARLAQFRKAHEPGFGLALSIAWVEAKILNSRRVLQRLASNRDEYDVSEALLAMDETAKKCLTSQSLDTLRGYEGTAAGRYFEALAGFFPDDCPFEKRSRRPPLNAANALLSFTYTLLVGEMEAQLHIAGLDPAVGFFHEPADRRPSLALDLIEPFRAPVADALALDLLNHKTLKEREHFETKDGGVYLNLAGRKKFFIAYERRLSREFVSEHTGLRTSIRGEFRNQALALKKAVIDNEPFLPFRMN